MFLAELDPIQIAIIVIAMGAGFVQWLWGMFKQNLEDKERRSAPPLSPEERAAREEIWRRQFQPTEESESTRQAQPAQRQRPARPSPSAPPPAHDPWATVRDVFEQIKEDARKAQNPESQPPSPPQRQAEAPVRPQSSPPPLRRPHPATVRAEVRPQPTPPPVPAVAFPGDSVKSTAIGATPPVTFATTSQPPRARLEARPDVSPDFRGLRNLLHSPASLKQAVLFREILGPPKALQSAEDSPF